MSFFSGTEQFISFINAETSEKCLDVTPTNYTFISDETGKKIMQNVSGCANASEFQKLERNVRNSYIQELRKAGLSIRQISRLTGISKTVVGTIPNNEEFRKRNSRAKHGRKGTSSYPASAHPPEGF